MATLQVTFARHVIDHHESEHPDPHEDPSKASFNAIIGFSNLSLCAFSRKIKIGEKTKTRCLAVELE